MQSGLTPEGQQTLENIAKRHGISVDAVASMLAAMEVGGGRMAQFDIPELGGRGQWMRGGMTMVGNMFDNTLKAKVDALCNDLSGLGDSSGILASPSFGARPGAPIGGNWWPKQLGVPSSSGGQNDTRYAIFPASHRLALSVGGVTRVFDTGEHRVTGVQQQQGGRPGVLTFTSQLGTFDVSALQQVGSSETTLDSTPARPIPSRSIPSVPDREGMAAAADAGPRTPATAPTTTPSAPSPAAPSAATPSTSTATAGPTASAPTAAGRAAGDADGILAAIEKLADLHSRGILTDAEFAAKKAELLGRL